ncbi:thiamine phosphate synthase [Azospirillum rugosum]|uniref:Thiamine-phosphate pyrophosphorylase n=1 Tax=Azospirillum rugosum TaxID=416170 RepID=A0ABS4SH28_9PROT|nr:thiamine phosphate synthase [Azospirillum rugosum]MBP2291262.1 thiamine-phosphate pyrophosphorylase [Azospirillum rugosum]MDQ0524674.1 thiamine-phosphate pyrophosphorylase [Azospirillum rugosum]
MTTLPTPPLLAITDRAQAALPLPELAERLFAAGLRWLSLREKDLPREEQRDLARALVERARPWGAVVTVHGDPALAREAGAAGVHLADGGDPAEARRLLGPGALIGLSAHGTDGLRRAAEGGADYATLSPVFPSASKPGYGPVLGLDGLRLLAQAAPVPVLALGGVGVDAAGACRDAGAAGVAVMGEMMRDPDSVARFLKSLARDLG